MEHELNKMVLMLSVLLSMDQMGKRFGKYIQTIIMV